MKADRTKKKANWLIRLSSSDPLHPYCPHDQDSGLPSFFRLFVSLNIVSDCLSDYRGGLQLPHHEKNIPDEDLMEAYSFNQLLSMVCSDFWTSLREFRQHQPSKSLLWSLLINAADFSPVFHLSPDEKKTADTWSHSLSPKVRILWYTNAKRCIQNAKNIFCRWGCSTTLASCSLSLVLINALGDPSLVSTICNCSHLLLSVEL